MLATSVGRVAWRGFDAYCAALSAPGSSVSRSSCASRTPARSQSLDHCPVAETASRSDAKWSRWLSALRFWPDTSSEKAPPDTVALPRTSRKPKPARRAVDRRGIGPRLAAAGLRRHDDHAAGRAFAIQHGAAAAHDFDALHRFDRDAGQARAAQVGFAHSQAVDDDDLVVVGGAAEAAQVEVVFAAADRSPAVRRRPARASALR